LILQFSDSTGIVKTVRLMVKGLQPGDYEVKFEVDWERHSVKDILSLEVPLNQSKEIRIRQVL
jgi:hypothetical protein